MINKNKIKECVPFSFEHENTCVIRAVGFFFEVVRFKTAAIKGGENDKVCQQLNCRNFKGNQEPFYGCWEKHPPKHCAGE